MAAIAARHARKLVPQAVAFQPRRNYSPSLWQAGRAILNRQFDGVYSPGHIEALFDNSHELMAAHSAAHLKPNFVTRLAWERLVADIHSQGPAARAEFLARFPVLGRTRVYLVCPENTRRSQGAAVLLDHTAQMFRNAAAGDGVPGRAGPARLHLFTGAGERPGQDLDSEILGSLQESYGLGQRLVRDEFPKPLLSELLAAADLVVAVDLAGDQVQAKVDQAVAARLKELEGTKESVVLEPRLVTWELSKAGPGSEGLHLAVEPLVQQLVQQLAEEGRI